MTFFTSLSSKSVFDFSFLFGSNIINKVFGFLREIVLAYIFGSSIIYASYLLIKTLTDFLSKFTFGNALQANILPKFSRLYKDNNILNLTNVYEFSKKVVVILFFSSLILQLLVVFFLIRDFYLILISTSFLLSLILSLNFHNSLFLNIIQAKGDFKKFSLAELLNGIICTFFIYPLALFFNIFGIALSRLLGIISLTYFYLNTLVKSNLGFKVNLSIKDFNFPVVFISNISLFVLLIARFISGLDGGSDITYFNYSFLLLNVVMTSVILNFNTIVLRHISLKNNLIFFYYSIALSIILSIILYFIVNSFSIEIVSLIFKRGAFNEDDVLQTAFFLRALTPSFIFLIFSTVFFQPFFSLGVENISLVSFKFLLFFISILFFVFVYIILNKISSRDSCFFFVNLMSISSFLISLLSLRYFVLYEN